MNSKKPKFSMIKGLVVGAIVGTCATMLVTNQKSMANKVKKTAQTTIENVSSMFKPN